MSIFTVDMIYYQFLQVLRNSHVELLSINVTSQNMSNVFQIYVYTMTDTLELYIWSTYRMTVNHTVTAEQQVCHYFDLFLMRRQNHLMS